MAKCTSRHMLTFAQADQRPRGQQEEYMESRLYDD